jgi:hypothetical protein
MANTTGQKYGGRTKGAVNKNTADIRAKFQLLINSNICTLSEDIKALKPLERLKVLIDLAKFVVPTLKAVEVNDISENENFQPVKIVFQKYESDTN